MNHTSRWISICAAACAVLASQTAPAAEVDLAALTSDTQKSVQTSKETTLVWWIPTEFWDLSFEQGGTDAETREATLSVIRDFIVVYVMSADIGPLGGFTFDPEQAIRANLTLVDSQGVRRKPLPADQLSPDMANLIAMLEPMLANAMGPMGQNFNGYVFRGKGTDGEPLAAATKPGSFSVDLGELSFRWRTPLGSLLPRKRCPKDDETFAGNYAYCPYDGTPLVAK